MTKKLRFYEIIAILLGAIIGWGCFMLPGEKFLPNSGVINTSIGLFLGTLSIIVIEKSYRFMMNQDIDEGGEFSYVHKFLGNDHGFVVGWFLSLAYISLIPLNAIAFPLVIDKISPGILNFGYLYNIAGQDIYIGQILISFIIILFFMLLNIRGVKNSGTVQAVIIGLLVVSVVVVSIGMFSTANYNKFYENYIKDYQFDFGEIASVFAITPFLFIGFDAIPQLVKDMNVSRKTASNMALASLFAGMFIYILMNLCTGLAFGTNELMNLDWALGSAVESHLGIAGFIFLIIALAGAVSGGINGFMICGSKLLGAMTNAKLLPAKLNKETKRGTRYIILIGMSIIALVMCFFGRKVVIWVVDMCSMGAAITYFYVCLTTFKIVKEKKVKVVAIIGALLSILFMCLLLIPGSPAFLSIEALICLGVWVGLGIIFFIRHKLLSRREKEEN